MRIPDLHQFDKESLMFLTRDIFTGKPEFISDPPTKQQMQALRRSGFVVGPNQELLRITGQGLRECKHGIPCHHHCAGCGNGCTNIPFPSCGVADGACLFTGKPCHSGCESKSPKLVQKELF